MSVLTAGQVQALVTVSGGRFDLSLTDLGSASVLAAFGPFLPGGHLVLTGVTARTDTPAGVSVSGTGAAGPFTGMAVTAELQARPGEEARAVVTAVGDASWTFTTAFPILRPTLWRDLTFARPSLVLDSAAAPADDDAFARIPMTFTGSAVIGTRQALLDLVCSGVEHTLTGTVTMMPPPDGLTIPFTPVPAVHLHGPDAPGLDLGLVRTTGVRYDLYAIPRFNAAIADYDVVGRILVIAGFPVTAAGKTTEVGLLAQLANWGDDLTLETNLRSLGDLSFADVLAVTGQNSGVANPFGLVFNGPVRLTQVGFTLTAQPSIAGLHFTLETAETWDLGNGFELQDLDVVFRIDDPLGPDRSVNGVVTGLLGFGEHGTLKMTADFGARALGGALRPGDGPLSIREVYSDLTGADPSHLPDLVVTNFELYGTLPQGGAGPTFLATVAVDGTWELTDSLALKAAGFDLDYNGADVTFTAWAQFAVAGILLGIRAGHDPLTGWNFSGRTGPGQRIPLGAFVADLAREHAGLAVPAPIKDLTVSDLAVEISSADSRLYVSGEARMPIDTTEIDLTVAIDTYARTFGGRLIATTTSGLALRFDAHFAEQAAATLFAAAYTHGPQDPLPTVKDLIGALSPTAAEQIPDGIHIGIDQAVYASDGTVHVFGVDLHATLDLAKLPVIGPRLTGKNQIVGFDPLRVIGASGPLPKADVAKLNALLPAQAARLPEEDLQPGFSLSGLLRLGPLEAPVTLPATSPAPPTKQQAQTPDNVLWHKVQADFGPVHLEQVGLSYLHTPGGPALLAVLLDAGISVGGLTLTCDRLSAGLSLSDPAAGPTFDLAGLGLAYAEGPVQISGAFLKDTITYDGKPYPAYSGKAVITTETFTIGALGSYVQLDADPSLFVYAFLDYPIGGPAFFFVTGLAAGFGYNRKIIVPDVTKVADFPLVAEAVGAQVPAGLAGELKRLEKDLPPSPGDYFLAIGVRFTSFEMIDSFLLLTAGFGHRFEMNILGLSTLILPAPDASGAAVTPVAELQLAVKATFAPDDGYFSLQAQLTPESYLLSKACKLTGGFAFSTWFGEEHHGDFVLTVGGYHPHFTPPAHYPAVPRLGFVWQVSPQLVLKGSAYYALTPNALMAGASLAATYTDDSLLAWFDASIDFIIAWQPYHYEAAFHLAVGASYTFSFFGTHTITVHLGADVRFWGPDFGGTATIDLSIISFTITFGSAEGDGPQPIGWDRFRDAQLPARDQIATIALQAGGVQPGSGLDLGCVNARDLRIRTDSVIPAGEAVTVAPVAAAIVSTHTITITRDGVPAGEHFTFEPVTKALPAALWGDELVPTLTKPVLVADLLTGYTVAPLPPDEPADPPALPMDELRAGAPMFIEDAAFDWHPLPAYILGGGLDVTAGASVREAIAGKLLPGFDVDLAGLTAADFLVTPEVATRA
jgi:hypothetical protein